jgi:hypothetical protein
MHRKGTTTLWVGASHHTESRLTHVTNANFERLNLVTLQGEDS